MHKHFIKLTNKRDISIMKIRKYLIYSIILLMICMLACAKNIDKKIPGGKDQMLILEIEHRKMKDGADVNIYLLNKSSKTINVIGSDYGGEPPIEITVKKIDDKMIDIIVMQHRTYAPGYKPSPPKKIELLAGNKNILGFLHVKQVKFLTGSYGLHGRINPGVSGFAIENYKDKPLLVSISYEKWIAELKKINPQIKNHDFGSDKLKIENIKLDFSPKSKKKD